MSATLQYSPSFSNHEPKKIIKGLIQLSLNNFRNNVNVNFDISDHFIILIGNNGIGKTNILEAISLLAPGRGLRSAKLSQMNNMQTQIPWIVTACLDMGDGPITIGSCLDPIAFASGSTSERRLVRINQTPVRSQGTLSEWLNVIWVVPAMTRLFDDSSSVRRKFIDRMVLTMDPTHSERVNRYDHFLRERSHLLKDSLRGKRLDDAWISTLEQRLAEDGIAITHARAQLVRQLTESQPMDAQSPFPRFFAQMRGHVEDWCRSLSALEAEEQFKVHLRNSRQQDAQAGGSAYGPHRGDLHVDHLGKQIPADLCSTGEQKMLLLALTLAFTQLLRQYRDHLTLLLLDDVVAHLDEDHRNYLFQELKNRIDQGVSLQVWMSGTDTKDFISIKDRAQVIALGES